MNLQQLYYFQKIAECQQYTKAAEELHVTQATLSYAITHLERELNVKLFDRKGKHVSLTKCGSVYLSCVKDALQALARGERMVRDLTSPAKALIRLHYLESLKDLIPCLIADLCTPEEKSALRFELANYTAPMIEQQVAHRETDFGLSSIPMIPGISSHLIGYQENVVVVSKQHIWADRDDISLSELDGQEFIAYSQDCAIRSFYDSILESAHARPEIFAEARFDNNILDMVSANMGVSIVPKMQRLTHYTLQAIPIRDKLPPRGIYVLWAKDAVLPSHVDQFLQRMIKRVNLSCYL